MQIKVYAFGALCNREELIPFTRKHSVCRVYKHDIIEPDADTYQVLLLPYPLCNLDSIMEFKSKGSFDVFAFVSPKHATEDLDKLLETFDDINRNPGVLQQDQIKTLISFHILLYEAPSKQVKPAKYELTLEKTHYAPANGVTSQPINISPLSYALVMARESCNFPKNICGIFDLKISLFCRGIILSNGVQVDPGYRGVLLSQLFNSNARKESLKYGDVFASIMFFSLSSKSLTGYSGAYLNSKKFDEYLPAEPRTGEFSVEHIEAHQKSILSLTGKVEKLESNVWNRISLWLGIVALLIALLVGSPIASHFLRLESIEARFVKIETLINHKNRLQPELKKRLDSIEAQLNKKTEPVK